MNKSTIKKARNLLNSGISWEETAEQLGYSVRYLKTQVKASYVSDVWYGHLNARAGKTVANPPAPAMEEIVEVILVETGYILGKGTAELLKESLDVYIPRFCIKELRRLAGDHSREKKKSSDEAKKFLTFFDCSTRFKVVSLEKEELFEESPEGTRIRSKGIVAVAAHLWVNGMRVRILTNSSEVERLVAQQGFGDEVIVVRV